MKPLKTLLVILLPLFAVSQNLSLKLGTAGPMLGQISFSTYLGAASGYYYYVQLPNSAKHEIWVYDLNHKMKFKMPWELEVNGQKTAYRRMIAMKNNSYALSGGFDSKDKVSRMFLHKVGADGKPQEGVQLLSTGNDVGYTTNTMAFSIDNNYDKDGLFISPDSSYLVYTESASVKATKNERLHVWVTDEAQSKKWDKEISLPYSDGELRIRQTAVTNEGKVVVVGHYFNIDGYRHKKISNHRTKLFVIDQNGYTEIDLDFSDKYAVYDAMVLPVAGNELTVFAKCDLAFDCMAGVAALKVDVEAKKVTMQAMQLLKAEDLDLGKSKGEFKKKGCVEASEFVSVITTAKGNRIVTMATSLVGESASQTYDKLIFAFDKDLSPLYTFGIKGWTSFRPSGTVKTTPLGDGYVVIYSDNEQKGNLLAVYVNAKGERSPQQKFPFGKMLFKPYNSQRINDRQVLIEGEAFGNFQFGTLSLD